MTDEKRGKISNRYTVSIIGSGANFEVPINELKDFENLEEILRILKKKMQ